MKTKISRIVLLHVFAVFHICVGSVFSITQTNICGDEVSYEGIPGIHEAPEGAPLIAIHRFLRGDTGAHVFTALDSEKEAILNELPSDIWVYEGEFFHVSLQEVGTMKPVFRLYNSLAGSHFYTICENEKAYVLENMPYFQQEGVAFYAFDTAAAYTNPEYRFYHLSSGSHFFTPSEFERDTLIATMPDLYEYDGVAFYAY